MTIEGKISISGLERGTDIPTGAIIRVATKLPITSELAAKTVIDNLRNITQSKIDNAPTTHLKRALDGIEELAHKKIVFTKVDTLEYENEPVYYHQIIIDFEQTLNFNSILYYLGGNLMDYVICNYGQKWNNIPTCPIPGVVYTIGSFGLGHNHNFVGVIDNTSPDFSQWAVDNCFVGYNNIAISFDANTDKLYNVNSILKYKANIWNNVEEAFNNRTINTLQIDQYDNYYGTFRLYGTRAISSGAILLKSLYSLRIKAKYVKLMLVLTDSEKLLQEVYPTLEYLGNIGIKEMCLTQYDNMCGISDTLGYNHIKTISLRFVNKNGLRTQGCNFAIRNCTVSGTVYYKQGKGQKTRPINIQFGTQDSWLNTFGMGRIVLPVNGFENKTPVLQLLEKIFDYLQNREGDWRELANEYVNLFKPDGLNSLETDDILQAWFKSRTRNSKRIDASLTDAYLKMKYKLEKEYAQLKIYVDNFDFSKCKSIPKIKLDKECLKKYYKNYNIELKKETAKSISGKAIEPITTLTPSIKSYIFKGRYTDVGELPLYHFYDVKTNTIYLKHNKVKGEMIRDKVKNWR